MNKYDDGDMDPRRLARLRPAPSNGSVVDNRAAIQALRNDGFDDETDLSEMDVERPERKLYGGLDGMHADSVQAEDSPRTLARMASRRPMSADTTGRELARRGYV